MSVKAFDLVPALDRSSISSKSTSQIVCLECSGVNLFVGTDDCCILCFLIEEKSTQNGKMLYTFKSQGGKQLPYKKPIYQLKAAPALNRILVLCDNILSMLNLINLEKLSSSPKVKGIGYFCLNENPLKSDPFSVEICTISKKKGLQLYTVTEDKMTFYKDITTQEAPLTMSMDGSFVCVALPTQYKIINYSSGAVQELFPYSGDAFTPIVTKITREEFLLSAPGALGMFATTTGISKRPPLSWNNNLFSVIYSHPYIVSLNDEFITVHSILDQQQKQSMPFQNGLALGEFDGKIFVMTAKEVYALMPIPVEKQIQSLLDDRNVKEALELAKNARKIGYSKDQFHRMYRRIQQQAAFIEFSEMHFEEATELFRSSQVDVRELIALYPHLLAQNSSFRKSVPPLHEIPDINILTRGDKDKTLFYKQFLLAYLEDLKNSGGSNTAFKQEVDTALLKLYAECSSPNLVTFITAEYETLNVDDCVSSLEKHKQYHALGLLYQFQSQYERALELWVKIVNGDFQDLSFPGFEFVVEFLSNLSDHDLVWKYAEWALKKDQVIGVQIFTERPPDEDSSKMSPSTVLDFLGKFPQAVISFLEFLVFKKNSQNENFHTHLAVLYLDKVMKMMKDKDTAKQDLDLARSKLRHMLQSSDFYRVQLLLGKLKDSDLHAEIAILHGKLGEHDKALRIFVHKLRDYKAAENYCIANTPPPSDSSSHGNSRGASARRRDPQHKHLFESLLEIYLDPKNDEETKSLFVEPTLSLLNNHKSDLDPLRVLNLLPSNWSINLLAPFLSSALRKSMSDCRTARIEANLSHAENIAVRAERMLLTREPIVINEDTKCRVCKQPFQEAKFVRYPNGVITHIDCATNKYVCPVTGKVFGTPGDSKNKRSPQQKTSEQTADHVTVTERGSADNSNKKSPSKTSPIKSSQTASNVRQRGGEQERSRTKYDDAS